MKALTTSCSPAITALSRGGALYISRTTLTANHCTISGNTSEVWGGAFRVDGGTPGVAHLNHSIVAGNTAPNGPNTDGAFVENQSLISSGRRPKNGIAGIRLNPDDPLPKGFSTPKWQNSLAG